MSERIIKAGWYCPKRFVGGEGGCPLPERVRFTIPRDESIAETAQPVFVIDAETEILYSDVVEIIMRAYPEILGKAIKPEVAKEFMEIHKQKRTVLTAE